MSRDTLSSTRRESLALHLRDVLLRRWVLAATVFAAVAAAAVAFALYLPDLYRAGAIVLVERPLSEAFVRPEASGELDSRLHVIKQEILSRDRLTALVNRFNLYPELRKHTSFEDVLTQTRHDIVMEANGPEQVTGRAKTVTFTLSYTGGSRDSVADVTNAIAAFYVEQNDLMRTEEATRTTEFLRAQVDEAKKQLDRQEQAMRVYTSSHTGEMPQSVGLHLATLERLNTQLRLNGEQQLRTIEQREKLLDGMPEPEALAPTAAAASSSPNPAEAPSKEWLDKMRKIESLKTDLTDAEARFASRHPDVVRLREQVATLTREAAEQRERDAAAHRAQAIAAQAAASAAAGDAAKPTPVGRRRTLQNVTAELDQLKHEEADLRQAIAATEHRLDGVPGTQQDFLLVQRDYQGAKDNYDQMLRKMEEAQLAEHVETDRKGERFRVIEPALPPEGPDAPNRLRLIFMGLLFAVAAAAAGTILAEQLDTSFHSVDDLREFTTLPVLATIPRIGRTPARRRVRLAFATASAVAAITLIATLSAYIAHGNEALVRLLGHAG